MIEQKLTDAIQNQKASIRSACIFKRDRKQFVKNVIIVDSIIPHNISDYDALKQYIRDNDILDVLDPIRNAGIKTYAETLVLVRN